MAIKFPTFNPYHVQMTMFTLVSYSDAKALFGKQFYRSSYRCHSLFVHVRYDFHGYDLVRYDFHGYDLYRITDVVLPVIIFDRF